MTPRNMTQFYKAKIEEVILDEFGELTPNLRIKVPSLHFGLKAEDLPIAKPLAIPGVKLNKTLFQQQLEKTQTVYVLFELGNLSKPIYLMVLDQWEWEE